MQSRTGILAALVGAYLAAPSPISAAPKAVPITCTEVEARLTAAANTLGEALPSPVFIDDPAWAGSRTSKSIRSVQIYLRCDKDRFQSYEAFILGGNTATLLRWTLWSQASLIATDKRLDAAKSFRIIERLQKTAIAESVREEFRSGDRSGCARLKSGPFEFEYDVQPGQVRVAVRPADDENDSCKLLR